MGKSTFFTGQPIFSQLTSFLSKARIDHFASESQSDRYYKKFDTFHHLISMLYGSFQHCTSLREITTGMQACEGRLQSLGIKHFPTRSTLSAANQKRGYEVFEKIYLDLYHRYHKNLPDSRKDKVHKNLILIDSTTISLFKAILKAAGNKKMDGRRKGGIKVNLSVWAHENVPSFVQFSAGSAHEMNFLQGLNLPKGSIAVFDKGFNSFNKYNEWNRSGVGWVTRKRANTVHEVLANKALSVKETGLGVRSDQTVLLGFQTKKVKVKCRMVHYYDATTKRDFHFITNRTRCKASTIAAYYKQRWGIELLFKRLKQNMQLQYFLGDNENAIKIQIYCSLIADLLLKVASSGLKRRWAFSNLASIVRLHLMNYTNLIHFLNNPEKAKIYNPIRFTDQLQLQLYG